MKKSIIKNIDLLKSFLNKEEYLRIRNNPYLNQEDTNNIFNSLYAMMTKAYNDGVLDPDNTFALHLKYILTSLIVPVALGISKV